MEFIRNLPRRLSKSVRMESWALFKCPDCLQEVERHLSSGKVNKSCGCQSFSKEWRQKVSLANKGKKRTEEQNKRNSESHIGLQVGKKNPKFGKKHTEETRIKQSKANKGITILPIGVILLYDADISFFVVPLVRVFRLSLLYVASQMKDSSFLLVILYEIQNFFCF